MEATPAIVSTSDLFDAHSESVAVCEAQFRTFGGKAAFCGECLTLAVTDDHHPVVEALKAEGRGRVLVVDGGGSLRVGVIGDRSASRGIENGWVGAIVFGAVRDVAGLSRLDFGVMALGATARRSFVRTKGVLGKPVTFGSVRFETGDWVYADADAVLVSRTKL